MIPPGVPVRIVVRGVSCTLLPERNGSALVFWLQYELLPHAASCRADEPWQVWADTDVLPPGAEVVAPGYAIVRR